MKQTTLACNYPPCPKVFKGANAEVGRHLHAMAKHGEARLEKSTEPTVLPKMSPRPARMLVEELRDLAGAKKPNGSAVVSSPKTATAREFLEQALQANQARQLTLKSEMERLDHLRAEASQIETEHNILTDALDALKRAGARPGTFPEAETDVESRGAKA